MHPNFSHMIAHAAGGRRYCFVIMSFHEGYAFFDRIKRIVAAETGFECLRADDIPAAGENLREKLHTIIDGAAFVLADISDARPNIYYEFGYAVAHNKPVLVLAREGAAIETDLVGMEIIRYADNKDGLSRFEATLKQYLSVHRDSNVSLLRAMIIPRHPEPTYIVLNPKRPNANSRFRHHPRERRTYGDYLGLMGVLGAFASMYGEHCAPELISASHAADDLAEWDANLFLIGSPKVNKFTDTFLSMMQRGRKPNWRFAPCPGENASGDYEVQLCGELSSRTFATPCGLFSKGSQRHDFGLIVRGPHPRHANRMLTIMAGPHSLGTGAACLAATRSNLVSEVSKSLAGTVDLSTQDRAIWILVEATAGPDGHLDPANVKIVEAGAYF
jgi:nucleoside 2-deoxyribosyltransferase